MDNWVFQANVSRQVKKTHSFAPFSQRTLFYSGTRTAQRRARTCFRVNMAFCPTEAFVRHREGSTWVILQTCVATLNRFHTLNTTVLLFSQKESVSSSSRNASGCPCLADLVPAHQLKQVIKSQTSRTIKRNRKHQRKVACTKVWWDYLVPTLALSSYFALIFLSLMLSDERRGEKYWLTLIFFSFKHDFLGLFDFVRLAKGRIDSWIVIH